MNTRRAFSMATLGLFVGGLMGRAGSAQPAGQPSTGQESQQTNGLPNRGRPPTGRIGAATRGARSADGSLALDLVAPLHGIGLTGSDQPTLFYLLSGKTAGPLRMTISTGGQVRPLADFELPHQNQPRGLSVVRLRDHGVRLVPNLLCVWSVALILDPRAASRNLVGNALIQYQPSSPALERAVQEAPADRRHAVLAQAGYWYDAVPLAERNRDRGAALAELFQQAELRIASGPPTSSSGR